MGNLLAIRVHKANEHDTKGGVATFLKAIMRYPSIKNGCADQGYRGTFVLVFKKYFDMSIDISQKIIGEFQVHKKRWAVERTFAWSNNSRRMSKDYEITTKSAEYMFMISHIATLLRRLQFL